MTQTPPQRPLYPEAVRYVSSAADTQPHLISRTPPCREKD